jgi:hypothetical protein
MIFDGALLTIIAAAQVVWSGWLHLKSKELDLKYKNLCKDCEHDFTPKKGLNVNKI